MSIACETEPTPEQRLTTWADEHGYVLVIDLTFSGGGYYHLKHKEDRRADYTFNSWSELFAFLCGLNEGRITYSK